MRRFPLAMTVTKKIIGDAPFVYEGDFAESISYAKDAGYDGVEIHADSPDEVLSDRLWKALEEEDMRVLSLGTGRLYINRGLSLIDDDPEIRQTCVRELKQFADAAKELDAVMILGCVRGNIPSKDVKDAMLTRLAESLKDLDEYVGKIGAKVVLEPINRYENNYLCSLGDVIPFLQDNGLGAIRSMFDTYHMNIEEKDIRQAILDAREYLIHAHFSDSNRLIPGEGHVDFEMIPRTLLEIAFNGAGGNENLPLPDKDTAARNYVRNLDAVMAEIGL